MRCHRHTAKPIDLATARVLYHILNARRVNRTWDTIADPDELRAARRLIEAGLIEQHGAALQQTPRCHATFNHRERYPPPWTRQPLADY